MKALFYILGIVFGALAIGQINLGNMISASFLLTISGFAFYTTKIIEDGNI